MVAVMDRRTMRNVFHNPDMSAAVFVDRDGVINQNRDDHVKSIREFVALPGALDAIVRLSRHYPVFVVTNQPIIAHGLATVADVEAIHAYLRDWVIQRGGMLADIYYCPHQEYPLMCQGRKPMAGMLHQAACDYGVDLAQSISVGDQLTDIQAGRSAGLQTILVRSGLGIRQQIEWPAPDLIVDDLATAADAILSA